MTVPQGGKAIIINETGGSDKLVYTESRPVPKPGPGQILVKNDYAGVNFIDTYFRGGLYPLASFPHVLGQEGLGSVVEANGNDLGFKEGDRVVWMAGGSYAEYTAVPAARTIKVPAGLDEQHVLGGFLMGMTALSLIQEAYPVKKGDKVLLHAAAGAMGLLLSQLLRSLGAYTIGTAGSPERCQLAKEAGANEVIDYNANPGGEWVKKVLGLTGGEGVDVVYDSVGKTTWEGSLEAVKRKGKGMLSPCYLPAPVRTKSDFTNMNVFVFVLLLVVYWGNSSGPVPPINLTRLAPKSLSIQRSTLMAYIVTRAEFETYANKAFDLLKSGALNVKVHKVYDLKDAKQAHDDLEGRKTSGKLLLKI
ncbi:hypothetical protein DV737_g1070, partial [Chaetothyriales sp. CBS 132003]